MIRSIHWTLTCLLLLSVSGCGGGGGSVTTGGGIGGTGLRIGPIQQEPGVVVAGIAFDVDAATVQVNGLTASPSTLQPGMVAAVEGTIASSGTTGVASDVRVDDVVKGPVSSIIDTNNLVINGQTVEVDLSTVFAPGISPASLGGVTTGDILEVYGFIRGSGVIRATRIERESPPQERRVTGFAHSITSTTFTIGAIVVDYSGADVGDLPSGSPTNGMLVRVEAEPLLGPSGELVATRVEPKDLDDDFDDNDDTEVEGFVTAISSPSQFVLGGSLVVQTSAGTLFEGGTAADVVVGSYLEVKGGISSNTMLALEIEFESSVKLESNIAALPGANTFTLVGLPGIVVQVDGLTEYEDDAAIFSDLAAGDHVRVEARVLSGSTVIATKVKETSPRADVELQGPIDGSPAPSDPLFSVLGVPVDTSALQSGDFEGVDETDITRSAFFAALTPGSIVKVQGELAGSVPVWDEAGLEGLDD